MQKHVNLVDLVKSFPTSIFLQNLASIQQNEPSGILEFGKSDSISESNSHGNPGFEVRGQRTSPNLPRGSEGVLCRRRPWGTRRNSSCSQALPEDPSPPQRAPSERSYLGDLLKAAKRRNLPKINPGKMYAKRTVTPEGPGRVPAVCIFAEGVLHRPSQS